MVKSFFGGKYHQRQWPHLTDFGRWIAKKIPYVTISNKTAWFEMVSQFNPPHGDFAVELRNVWTGKYDRDGDKIYELKKTPRPYSEYDLAVFPYYLVMKVSWSWRSGIKASIKGKDYHQFYYPKWLRDFIRDKFPQKHYVKHPVYGYLVRIR